jgi:large subunit ribosomal protein L3
MKGLIGKKVGMTQLIADDGRVTPVTIIEAGPCFVTQVRTPANEGYHSVQLGFEEVHPRRLAAGERGHLKGANLPPLRHLREFRGEFPDLKAGDKLGADVFAIGDHVDVIGISKGKGFQGPIKRYHFNRQPKSHGASDRTRAPGSSGQTTTPGRVYKGKRPGDLAEYPGGLCGRRAQFAGRQRQRARRQGHRRHYPRAQPVGRE